MSSRDGDTYRKRNRRLENVPADVRHSLDVLDDILGQFDVEEQRLDTTQRSFSSLTVSNPTDIPQDVRKSLEILDQILDEIEQEENSTPVFRHHFQSRDVGTQDRKHRHEDIRRSLDVLDSVLAEFDDCLESWDTHLDDPSNKKLELTDFNSNSVKSNNVIISEAQLGFLKCSRDSTTSHISPSTVLEQPRIVSPPPIPKRSPATKLSDRSNVSVFTFPETDNSLDSFDSAADLSSNDHVSQQRIRDPLSSDCCDTRKGPPDKCANCGRAMKKVEQQQTGDETNSSPFHQRKQMFEARIAEASSANVSRSPSFNRSYGTSFKSKRLETSSDVSSNLSSGESGFEDRSGKNSSELSVESPSGARNGFIGHHTAKCTCKDRIRQLDAKFSDVRRLIKLNKIRGLDSKPPGFVPPPPPIVSNGDSPHKTHHQLDKSTSSSKADLLDDIKSSKDNEPKTSTFYDSSLDTSLHGPESLRSASSINSLPTSASDSRLTDPSSLCNRCLSSLSVHLSETIEDLPKLLPTDALNRPHLGFSYSLEEDLPPGVKEIQQTSTPKSDVSSPRLFRTKESNLSTFSHSASSLGYISSQSDLELNDLSILPDKVPISTFKSRTLPNGLDRSPFYSAFDDTLDDTFDKPYSSVSEMTDHNDNRLLSVVKKADAQKRSSSAPLPPEPEKTKTRHFRVFSRKSKKDKKKQDSDTSPLLNYNSYVFNLKSPISVNNN